MHAAPPLIESSVIRSTLHPRRLVLAIMACALPLLSCETTGDGDPGTSPDLRVFTAAEVADDAPALADENPIRFVEDDGTEGGRLIPSDIELIYEEIRSQDASDRELTREARGTLTLEIWQRTSHPQFYLDASEPYVYHEEGGTTYLEDGTQRHHYRIRRQPNRSHAEKPVTPPGPPRVDAVVFEKWAEATGDEPLALMVRLAQLPEYQPPPLPPKGMFSESEEARALTLREAYLRDHAARFSNATAGFQAEVEAAGGHVLEVFPNTGWVSVSLPQAAMDALLHHPGINRVDALNHPTEDCACNAAEDYDCGASNPWWILGDGRRSNRLDADKFLNAGIDGRRSNSNRHQGLRLLAGVVESGKMEDESLALSTMDPNFGARRSVFDCAQNPCFYPQNPNELEEDGMELEDGQWQWVEEDFHGTSVTSVLAADFRLGQANGVVFGDHTYMWLWFDPTHCAEWVNASTGMAPGSAVIYANAASGDSAAYVRAYGVMQNENVDVLNCSHDLGSGCDIASSTPTEDELEHAYDDGILVVAASGNIENDGTNCSLVRPADTPKVLAVASLDAYQSACRTSYQNCVIDDDKSANGGMNATINGTTWSRVIAGIDLVAPQRVSNLTHAYDRNYLPLDGPWPMIGGSPSWPEGYNHTCDNLKLSRGSSIATPHVTGLALLLKHWQLNKGNTFFNYPGRMQALLLAMGDRWSPGYTIRRDQGISHYSGFGRIKLRHLDNANFAPRAFQSFAHSFYTYSSSVTNWVWPYKMPVGTNFVKCVLFEAEDMSVKSDISDLYLNVNLKNPDANGNCSSNSTMFRSRINSTHDIRHMVAHETDVAGKCVEYQIIKRHVTSTGSTVYGFCYFSSRYDFEDVAD